MCLAFVPFCHLGFGNIVVLGRKLLSRFSAGAPMEEEAPLRYSRLYWLSSEAYSSSQSNIQKQASTIQPISGQSVFLAFPFLFHPCVGCRLVQLPFTNRSRGRLSSFQQPSVTNDSISSLSEPSTISSPLLPPTRCTARVPYPLLVGLYLKTKPRSGSRGASKTRNAGHSWTMISRLVTARPCYFPLSPAIVDPDLCLVPIRTHLLALFAALR